MSCITNGISQIKSLTPLITGDKKIIPFCLLIIYSIYLYFSRNEFQKRSLVDRVTIEDNNKEIARLNLKVQALEQVGRVQALEQAGKGPDLNIGDQSKKHCLSFKEKIDDIHSKTKGKKEKISSLEIDLENLIEGLEKENVEKPQQKLKGQYRACSGDDAVESRLTELQLWNQKKNDLNQEINSKTAELIQVRNDLMHLYHQEIDIYCQEIDFLLGEKIYDKITTQNKNRKEEIENLELKIQKQKNNPKNNYINKKKIIELIRMQIYCLSKQRLTLDHHQATAKNPERIQSKISSLNEQILDAIKKRQKHNNEKDRSPKNQDDMRNDFLGQSMIDMTIEAMLVKARHECTSYLNEKNRRASVDTLNLEIKTLDGERRKLDEEIVVNQQQKNIEREQKNRNGQKKLTQQIVEVIKKKIEWEDKGVRSDPIRDEEINDLIKEMIEVCDEQHRICSNQMALLEPKVEDMSKKMDNFDKQSAIASGEEKSLQASMSKQPARRLKRKHNQVFFGQPLNKVDYQNEIRQKLDTTFQQRLNLIQGARSSSETYREYESLLDATNTEHNSVCVQLEIYQSILLDVSKNIV